MKPAVYEPAVVFFGRVDKKEAKPESGIPECTSPHVSVDVLVGGERVDIAYMLAALPHANGKPLLKMFVEIQPKPTTASTAGRAAYEASQFSR